MARSPKQERLKIRELEQARKTFSELEGIATSETSASHDKKGSKQDVNRSFLYDHFFLIASYAVGKLELLGRNKLLELENEGSIHTATITGSSLLSARNSIERYVCGVREFSRDDYEQLGRACYSVRNLLEKNHPYLREF